MKRRRHTPEQIVRKLREADRMLAGGIEVPEVAKALEVSEAIYHRWRARFGGMKADDVKRLKELAREWRKNAETGRAITHGDSTESLTTPRNAPIPTPTDNNDPDQPAEAAQAAPVVSLRSPSGLAPGHDGTTLQPDTNHRLSHNADP